jgi:hypothetical protein
VSLLKFLYPKRSLKRKILEIKESIQPIVRPICDERLWVSYYGAYDIDPKHLVFWICVQSDNMKSKLRSDEQLVKQLRSLLDKHDYPQQARASVIIDFESQETVDRESNGNWYAHFK